MHNKLQKISPNEWENVCKRCGRCCLIKLQDEDSNEIYYTNIICKYYDVNSNVCTVYDKRCELVPECIKLTPENVNSVEFMPQCCAYRKLFDPNYKERQLKSLKGQVVSEENVNENELEDHIVDWEEL